MTQPLDLTVSQSRARAFWLVAISYAVIILTAPIALGAVVYRSLEPLLGAGSAVVVAAMLAVVSFAVVPGVLSLPHQRWIVPGRMPTNVGIRAYFHRRLYGLCWTSLYYNQPVYWVVLSLPWLKLAVFRLFGYRGAARFTVYPDTWIRDLPLLRIGEGAYLSNKATIGTNMILQSRQIVVDEVEVGAGATVGHLACLAPGARCEADSEVGVATLVGLRVRIGSGARVGARCLVDHGARVGDKANVESGAYIGCVAMVGPGVFVPAMSVIRSRARVGVQADLVGEVERSVCSA